VSEWAHWQRCRAAAKALHGPCNWPECACGERWSQFADEFERGAAPSLAPMSDDEFDDLLVEVVAMLACVAKRCPVPGMRRHATLQLLHPVFTATKARLRWAN